MKHTAMFGPSFVILGVILLHVSLIYGDDQCGTTTFNGTTGQLKATDPGKGKNCTYYIVAGNYTPQVAIQFKVAKLDAAVFNLTVYGGNTTTSPVIANLTQVSHELPYIMVISSYNVTKIVFSHADTDIQPTSPAHFSASFDTIACLLYEQSLGGVIQSPIYKPNNGSVNCLYKVRIPLQTMVVVSFLNLSVTNGSVDVTLGRANKTSVTGTTLPADIFGSMNASANITFDITFNSSADPQNFSASFQTIDPRCSGAFVASDNFTLLGIPQNNHLPVKCYAQIQVVDKKIFVKNGEDYSQKSGGFDSIVYYDGTSTQAPVIGTLSDGLNWFSSSGQSMTVVANLGARSSRGSDIQYRSDSFSDYYQITDQSIPITCDFDGASVMNQSVRLQFESKVSSSAVVKIEVVDNTSITDAIITVQSDHGKTMFIFTKDSELFPVVVPSVRALVTITNLNGVQKVSLRATTVQSTDCNQIFTQGTGEILLVAASTQQRYCNLLIATGTDVILDLSQVKLCKTGTLDIYQGFNKKAPKVVSLNATTSSATIQQIWFPSGSGPRLVWKDNNNTCIEPIVVGRYWTQNHGATCGMLSSALTGTVKTPNYPNQYPLNIKCKWTLPPATSNASVMYLSVNAIDLPLGQSLTLQNSTNTVANISGRTLPADVIVPNKNLSLIFNTGSKVAGQSGQGTELVYKALTCGGLVTKYPANLTIPSTKNQSVECIWIIQVPATGANKSVNIVAANITVTGYKSASNGTLEIHDGSSVRDPLVKVNMTQKNTTVILGRSSFMFVRYAYTLSTSAPFSVNFTYTVYNCNSSSVCDKVTCIHPGWRCNGILDCKDGTDEIHCNGSQPIPPVTTPVPPAPGTGGNNGGVSAIWVVVCLVLGIALGVIITVMVPQFIRRMRQRNMSHASNYGSLHEDT